MSLTFYFAPMSTASTVLWSLAELGAPYEGVRVNLRDEADKKKKLGPVNPNMKVPVLVHEGSVIFESAAIQIYLGETFGADKGVYPAPGPQRGEAHGWLVWGNATLVEAVGRWQNNVGDFLPVEQRNAAAGEEGRKDLAARIGILEAKLATTEYLVGGTFSLADLHLVSIMEWIGFTGFDLKPFPKVTAWVARCTGRPSHARAEAIEAG